MNLAFQVAGVTPAYAMMAWLYLTPTPPSVYTILPVLGQLMTAVLHSDIARTREPGVPCPIADVWDMRRNPATVRTKAKQWAVAFTGRTWDGSLWKDLPGYRAIQPSSCGCYILSTSQLAPVTHFVAEQGESVCEAHTRAHAKFLHPSTTLDTLPTEYLVGWNLIFPPERSSADGKQLLDANAVLSNCSESIRKAFSDKIVREGVPDWTNIMVGNVALCAEHDPAILDVMAMIPRGTSFLGHLKCLKKIHTHVRVTGLSLTTGLSEDAAYRRRFYGLDYMMGRSDFYPLDFLDEMVSRMVPPSKHALPRMNGKELVFDKEEYNKLFAATVDKALREILLPETHLLSFEELMERRLNWVSSGSAPGVKLTHTVGDTTEKGGVNKRVAFTHLDTAALRREMHNHREAVLHSRHATKFEPGKKRALWNTGLMHYSSSSVLLEQFANNERKNVPWYMPSHTSAFSTAQDFVRVRTLRERIGVMWDFSDFNINHLLEHMAYLYKRAGEILVERNVSGKGDSDVLAAAKWVAASTMETWLEDAESGVTAKVKRSLMTGVRGTSFVNTILNHVYTEMAREYALRLGGVQLLNDPTYAFGDDVFSSADSHAKAVLFCHVMNTLGTAGTTYKINLELGELLRVSYDETGFSGYPLRALVGLVSGEYFEGNAINDIHQRAAAFHEQVRKCVARGANLDIDKWYKILMNRHCSLKVTKASGKRLNIEPNIQLIYTPAVFGGLGLIKSEMPKTMRLHEWTSTVRYPIFEFERGFAQSIVGTGFRDRELIVRLVPGEERKRLIGVATNEVGQSIIGGKAPPSQVKYAFRKYVDGFVAWRKGITKGLPIDLARDSEISMDVGRAEALWFAAMRGRDTSHVYDSQTSVSSMAGFSSNSAFSQTLDYQVRVNGHSLSQAMIAIATKSMPVHMRLRVFTLATRLSQIPAQYRRAWFNGEFGFLPVVDCGSAKLNSMVRWMTMSMVESDIARYLVGTKREIVIRVAGLEQRVRRYVLSTVRRMGITHLSD
ncbi:RNA-dependent RNA polymerase [Phytophthora infestans RNA virus 3]|uniref:RNA-directed RNA polymerase n=1 Tax=Phytophthora infestans RNA virus 3 TaxID=1133557 RepID=H2DG68_9VIRU|nr:RNA-dependent RNA polymerase [Phytophthora infestans RNA virus 3]AEX87902.1 RNA-dependent RNA polymerase [Phytophthora infestans RNA virus 3]